MEDSIFRGGVCSRDGFAYLTSTVGRVASKSLRTNLHFNHQNLRNNVRIETCHQCLLVNQSPRLVMHAADAKSDVMAVSRAPAVLAPALHVLSICLEAKEVQKPRFSTSCERHHCLMRHQRQQHELPACQSNLSVRYQPIRVSWKDA